MSDDFNLVLPKTMRIEQNSNSSNQILIDSVIVHKEVYKASLNDHLDPTLLLNHGLHLFLSVNMFSTL